MEDKHIKVLLVEDNIEDTRLIQEMLSRANGPRFEVTCAESLSTGLELLTAGGIDVVLLDLGLPDSTGMESFARTHTHAPEIPIVVLSGLDDETLAVTAVREGAQDYLIKGHVDSSLLERSIRYAIERKRTRAQISAALSEKEILLRELQHRVKNNLRLIDTLLQLQAGYIKDKEVLAMFEESQNRIRSMALIHDKLYQFKDLGKIDIAHYIQELATDLADSYGVDPDRIKLKINVHEVLLGIDTAIPCGLIINELVSNALKHAFPDGREGEIRIDFLRSVTNSTFTLVIKDNGIGFPKEVDFQHTETMGLQLVNTLVKQLNGTIELDRSGGTKFQVTFTEKRKDEKLNE